MQHELVVKLLLGMTSGFAQIADATKQGQHEIADALKTVALSNREIATSIRELVAMEYALQEQARHEERTF